MGNGKGNSNRNVKGGAQKCRPHTRAKPRVTGRYLGNVLALTISLYP
jgi:hypothetical protein